MKLTDRQIKNREEKVRDKSLSMAERRKAHAEIVDAMMNPDEEFDPSTFDPMKETEGYDVKKRKRKAPPTRLPTMGILPKEILEGQMVGMFESKQDLYLMLAHYINNLLDRIEKLEEKVDNSSGQKK